MSHHKAIASGKEHRQEYRKAKAMFTSCRNHGSCTWCLDTRTHNNTVRAMSADEQIVEFGTIESAYEYIEECES